MRELLTHGLRRQPKGTFWALRNVSFKVQPGEGVGVIGSNGTGKSTLLRLIAGVLLPDEGAVTVRGDAALLNLRAGLSKDLTGRENVYLVGALHGLDTHTVDACFDQIVEFAEVEDFIDAPIRHYSTGMQARLGFAVVSQVETPILLMDEVLAVGDRSFRKKCYAALEKILADGRTLILVSHNERDLERFCGRGLFIQHGRLAVDGTVQKALAAYSESDDRERAGRR
ncbi:MAG: ABC transporter ATP-binding protein [Streptosporangiaceae bacterium]